jgi:hypothetical protein
MQGGPDDLSPDVRAFIAGQVASVVQLETLLMLHGSPERQWAADEVARDLRIDRAWAEGQLEALCRQGLAVGRDEADGWRYRYGAAAPVGPTIDALARAYAERRVTVISLIFAKPADALRAFSDAFRIRKDRDEPRG